MRRTRRLPVILALACLVTVAACTPEPAEPVTATAGPQPPPADEVPARTLRWAVERPKTLTPTHLDADDRAGTHVVDAVFDSLTRWDDDLVPRPAAAVAWESDDARVWRFTLRDGATFHDGTPVTAASFKSAWEALAREGPLAHHLADVDGFAALQAGTTTVLRGLVDRGDVLEVRLRRPNAELPAVVGHPAFAPLPAGAGDGDDAAEQPVGNGPFVVREVAAGGEFARLERFDGWRAGPAPALDEVLFRFLDSSSGYLALQQGRVDVAVLPTGATASAVARFGRSGDGRSGPGVVLVDAPTVHLLALDTAAPPLDDVEVRRAVSMALDRSALVEELLDGRAVPARAIVPPTVPGARRLVCAACSRAPATAARLLDERDVDAFVLGHLPGGSEEQVVRRLRADLSGAGVRLSAQELEGEAYPTALAEGHEGLVTLGWTVEVPTLDDALRPLLHSAEVGAGFNASRYADPEVDRLLDEARAILDPVERRARYQQAEDLAVGRDQAYVPLFTTRQAVVVGPGIRGFRLGAMGDVDLTAVRLLREGS